MRQTHLDQTYRIVNRHMVRAPDTGRVDHHRLVAEVVTLSGDNAMWSDLTEPEPEPVPDAVRCLVAEVLHQIAVTTLQHTRNVGTMTGRPPHRCNRPGA